MSFETTEIRTETSFGMIPNKKVEFESFVSISKTGFRCFDETETNKANRKIATNVAVLQQSAAFVSVCLTEACAIPGRSHHKDNMFNNNQ
jgi:hypothetical protein